MGLSPPPPSGGVQAFFTEAGGGMIGSVPPGMVDGTQMLGDGGAMHPVFQTRAASAPPFVAHPGVPYAMEQAHPSQGGPQWGQMHTPYSHSRFPVGAFQGNTPPGLFPQAGVGEHFGSLFLLLLSRSMGQSMGLGTRVVTIIVVYIRHGSDIPDQF